MPGVRAASGSPPSAAPGRRPRSANGLRAALQAYIDLTQPYRKQAAQAGENVPGKAAPTPAAEEAVRTRQDTLADALRSKLRPNATQSFIFTQEIAQTIKRQLDTAVASVRRDLILDELAEQSEGTGQHSLLNTKFHAIGAAAMTAITFG